MSGCRLTRLCATINAPWQLSDSERWGAYMPATQGAVGAKSFRPNGVRSIETRVTAVEGRMDALEQTLVANRAAAAAESTATHKLLQEVIDGLGKPSNGPSQPASGVYWAIEGVSGRLKPFEQRWEQVKGSMTTAAIILGPTGLLLWFLAGDKITKLLHG